jgi:putative sigma-54 modulation protein
MATRHAQPAGRLKEGNGKVNFGRGASAAARLHHPVDRARLRTPDSTRRASVSARATKGSNHDTADVGSAQIAAHVRAAAGGLGPTDRAYIRRKLGTRLRKFSSSIERVSLRTEDVNGPRGGIDQVCQIKVVLRGLPTVVYELRDAALNAAVDGALAGAERAVRRAVQRRRMKPLKRAS